MHLLQAGLILTLEQGKKKIWPGWSKSGDLEKTLLCPLGRLAPGLAWSSCQNWEIARIPEKPVGMSLACSMVRNHSRVMTLISFLSLIHEQKPQIQVTTKGIP